MNPLSSYLKKSENGYSSSILISPIVSFTMGSPKISFLSAFSLIILVSLPVVAQGGGGVFRVKRKYAGGHRPHINDLKKHDGHRHSRMLSGKPIDVYLGGNLTPALMWYTDVMIGTPPQNLTVHIDTGSDILWVNCEGCKSCPTRNDSLGIKLSPYNPKVSKSAKIVAREESICEKVSPNFGKNISEGFCNMTIGYLDGSGTYGYFVTDLLNFNHVSNNQENQPAKEYITFGCATNVTGNPEVVRNLLVKLGVQGIIGFAQGDASLISQLASSGKVRKQFAHCLDNKDGGIFAIGHVVQPKVKLAPLLQESKYYSRLYTILLESIDVDGQSLKEEQPRLTVIDSGATTVHVPRRINDFLEKQVFSKHPKLSKYYDPENSTCFHYSGGSLDKDFPIITLRFSNSLTLQAYPHEYIIPEDGKNKKDLWCLAWGISKMQVTIGDLFLRDKLVVYDAENKLVGWKEYNCSSSIKVEDDTTGGVCDINAHNYTAALS